MKAPGYAPSVGLSDQPLSYQRPADYSALQRGIGMIGQAGEELASTYQKEQDRAAYFKSLVDFSNLESKLQQNTIELQRASKPGSTDLLPNINKMVDTEQEQFLKGVPDKRRPEFEYRINQLRQGLNGHAIDFQYKQNDEFYKAGSESEFLKSQIDLQNDPSVANLTKQQAKIETFIRAQPLSEADKETMILQARAGLQGIALLHHEQNAGWVGGTSQQVGPKIVTPDDYYTRLRQIEHGQNPNSSAHGQYGFIDSTRASLGLSQNPTRAEEDAAIRKFTEANRAGLRSALGRDPTPGELYLAHQQGLGGAVKLLQNPNAPAVTVVGADAVRLNGGTPNMTAQQFADKWINTFERRRGSNVGLASTNTDPAFKDVPFDQRLKIDNEIGANFRTQITQSTQDEAASIDAHGQWGGIPPSREAFTVAYGEKAQGEWDKYQAGKQTAIDTYNYRSMPEDQIAADLTRSREAIGTGPGAALATAVYNAKVAAADAIHKERIERPGDSVYKSDAAVRGLWDNIKLDDPNAVGNAILFTEDKQAQLGIPANLRQPMPGHIADQMAMSFEDPTKPVDSRADAFYRLVTLSADPKQQLDIAKQLIASGKLTASAEASVIAAQRGDREGSRNLFAVAMGKPDDWPLSGADKTAIQVTKDDIDQFLVENVKAPNSRGDIYYGLAAGDPANAARANRDTQLLEADVRMRLSRGEKLEDAKNGALKDLFGDTSPVTRTLPSEGHVSILLPSDQNEAAVIAGMSNLTPRVRAVVADNVRSVREQSLQALSPEVRATQQPLSDSINSAAVNDVMAQGGFRRYGGADTFGWWDPVHHGFVADTKGNVLLFSMNDVLKESTGVAPEVAPRPPTAFFR